MRGFIPTVLLLTIFHFQSFGQKYTISGSVKDNENGEDLIGATVLVKEMSGVGTVTNVYGFYSITLPAGSYTILYSYLGYDDVPFHADLTKDLRNDIELSATSTELGEVTVRAKEGRRECHLHGDECSQN